MTLDEIQTLKAEVTEALKTLPPWHRVCVGMDGKVHVVPYSPKPIFGKPTDGTLFTETADDR